MNKKYNVVIILLITLISFSLVGCSNSSPMINDAMYEEQIIDNNPVKVKEYKTGNYQISGMIDGIYSSNNSYETITEFGFLDTNKFPTSTISLNSSTASYTDIKNSIINNYPIRKDQVRIEDMLNYFNYDYKTPTENEPFALASEMMICPWNSSNYLVSASAKAQEIDLDQSGASNIVLLIDISGSMRSANKIGLVKDAFLMLTNNLRENDKVSIITYASGTTTVLDGAKCDNKIKIMDAINALQAGGSTFFSNAIDNAYDIALKHFIKGGNNRIILATDGDFNVGITSINGLKKLIKANAAQYDIYMSIAGFGYGNRKDDNLETLANNGNGTAYYVNDINEARRVFVSELGGTMITVAKDVKAQLVFNPKYIDSYRMIGYENKQLSEEDFTNDNVDAGEINSGHVATCVYEVILTEEGKSAITLKNNSDALYEYKLAYKNPFDSVDNQTSKYLSYKFSSDMISSPSNDMLFAISIVEFALLLRNSDFLGSANYQQLIERLNQLPSSYMDEYKLEFIELVKLASIQ